MNRSTVAKITTNGQVSLPAPVRRRWKAAQVVLEDLGDRIIVRPLPDDPIAAACGSLNRRGPTPDRVRQAERRADGAKEAARLPLATSDPHLARAASAEGVKVIGLPDSRGHRPAV